MRVEPDLQQIPTQNQIAMYPSERCPVHSLREVAAGQVCDLCRWEAEQRLVILKEVRKRQAKDVQERYQEELQAEEAGRWLNLPQLCLLLFILWVVAIVGGCSMQANNARMRTEVERVEALP